MGLECVEKKIFSPLQHKSCPLYHANSLPIVRTLDWALAFSRQKFIPHPASTVVMIVCAFYATGRFQQQSLCVSGKQVACCQKLDWGQQSQASGSKLMPHRVKPDG
ncbi:hypothetical protein T02_9264 [Trichinella nativa]|uniref:Uncharacterized protein n=1 Tax=Trichinella nativa TaxID=6335 RepID=A0A0V1LEL5_9BILA|nr:hypothetical protein T02_9264 [Trichinella nativa]